MFTWAGRPVGTSYSRRLVVLWDVHMGWHSYGMFTWAGTVIGVYMGYYCYRRSIHRLVVVLLQNIHMRLSDLIPCL